MWSKHQMVIRTSKHPAILLAVLVLLASVACQSGSSASVKATTVVPTFLVSSPTASASPTTPEATSEPAQAIATPEPSQAVATQAPTAISTLVPVVPLPDKPSRLKIPAIGVDAPVDEVGLTNSGAMGVPKNWDDVAWFAPGARPGAPGNAVIDGHLDSYTGPAVFARLSELKAGDALIVVTTSGQQLHFTITDTSTVNADKAPLTSIFGPDLKPHLNLITCEGTWDSAKQQYNQRLVIYSQLDPAQP